MSSRRRKAAVLTTFQVLADKKLTWIAIDGGGIYEMEFEDRDENSAQLSIPKYTLCIAKTKRNRQKKTYYFLTDSEDVEVNIRAYDTLKEARAGLALHKPD